MTSFDTPQHLNSVAIGLLAEGNTTASLGVLRHALQVARGNCGVGRNCSHDHYTMQVIHLGDNSSIADTAFSNDFDVFEGVFAVSQPQTSFSLNQKHTNESDKADCVTDDIEILVLLYNFAFAMHKDALLTKLNSERKLSKALSVYHMANECVSGIPLHEHPELSTLILALSTNQGHIHSHFFQQKEVKIVHDQIEEFLTYTNPTSLLQDDYFFFEHAALTSGFATTKMPPAA
mmetsp:Transcript_6878/g.8912  ORF Transcript_6878/g.8912 Transcript_6878/m.8912 type:complete len:233 (+) Transcript_6878:38-736(+)